MLKARLLGHPIHPPLTDFPIVLLFGATLCDVAGALRESTTMWTAGYWLLVLGLLSSLPTMATGLLDFMSVPQEASRTAYGHLYAVALMLTMYSVSFFARWSPTPPEGTMQSVALICESLGAILLMVAGWFGGHLVFHHGLGKSSEPSHQG